MSALPVRKTLKYSVAISQLVCSFRKQRR